MRATLYRIKLEIERRTPVRFLCLQVSFIVGSSSLQCKSLRKLRPKRSKGTLGISVLKNSRCIRPWQGDGADNHL